MDFELRATPAADTGDERKQTPAGSGFEISAAPIVPDHVTATEQSEVLRASGPPTLCLMARDPHTLFAYWDVDWPEAFAEQQPIARKVHLRVFDADGTEQALEVEPMAGSCYVPVAAADTVYTGELGFYRPTGVWIRVATSQVISTPPDAMADFGDDAFATVPFHLSFQHMIDMLRSSRRPNEAPLIVELTSFREQASSEATALSPQERELAQMIDEVTASAQPAGSTEAQSRELWRRERLERLLGFGASSPSRGFGGSSRYT